ncbi:MAG TPA: sigma-70 family RNA polymerase sigma factor [Thermoanaerobaculia bacterium]|nr:sigma-70 family RNA polymerase sigma factor [Thermoanaerobaculia bacterium]
MNPDELFRANLALIDRVIDGVCRRARLRPEDAEDFASNVKVALMEDDYAILRKYEERSSLKTFLTVVVQRLLVDERMRSYGRWHPSAEAKRMGEAAVLLETMLYRDRRALAEVVPHVRALDPALAPADVERMAARLPERGAVRPRAVALDEETFVAAERADARALDAEARRLSERASRVIRETLDAQTLEDRMLVRFRFGSSMTIAKISQMMRLPQRPLYRRLESLLERMRNALTAAGIDASAVEDLRDIVFGLAGKAAGAGLSMERDAQ